MHEGGCACGRVRFKVAGSPIRVGLCHCFACRKFHRAVFNALVVFKREHVIIIGPLSVWRSSGMPFARDAIVVGHRLP
jgi:hypothetical protein